MTLIGPVAKSTLASKPPGLREKEITVKVFKVMTQKDRAFGGKFNPEKIEEALNAMGKEGWEIDGVTSAEFPSLTGGRQELVIFLSKDV